VTRPYGSRRRGGYPGPQGSSSRPRPVFKRSAPVSVGEIIADVVRPKKLGKHDALSRLQELWVEAVGAKVARETRLAHFRGGVLTVETRSSALAQELSVYLKRPLIKRLKEQSGLQIRDLRCRVGGWEEEA
jgi:predicted nucleic acid-binding Zn ribbon protein